ncbi:cell envelope integrity protein TolA [Providencia rettgeri]|uniref:cell envelope integrity protein TolA n=1 Tax=Providencia rettgeri TaxID=587 RepID=UPI0016583773|nr:cell envelope integrity protein TolA [Providencia rettgeri]QNP19415.1 hypothetical protein H9L31_16225 [Providencia rettgeri]
MKIIDDICSSITGNAKTRVKDPFVGTFICSWVLCNWHYLSLLFWGDGTVSERVGAFYLYLSRTPILEWNYLFSIPFLISLFYLFVFPWVSLFVKYCQHWANEKSHAQAIDIERVEISQKKDLNIERLMANPNKPFLEQLAQQKIDKRDEIIEHLKQRTTRLEAKAIEAKDKTKEQEAKRKDAEIKLKISSLELEKKNNQAELERRQFEANSAKIRATKASHRFPSAYYLISAIDKSLREDEINISIKTLGDIVAALFGYENFESLLNDDNFNNENVGKVEYVYYDDGLANSLEKIVQEDNSDNENFSADILFDHLQILFENAPFKLITGDSLAEKCLEEFENNPYYVLDHNGTSAAIAESNTYFEDIDDIHIVDFDFDSSNGFSMELSATASGTHYKEQDISGRTMTISITMKCELLVGKYGLGSIEEDSVSGDLVDDWDEYEDEDYNAEAQHLNN